MIIEVKPKPIPINGILYYWCVNCGFHGKFSFPRTSQCDCESCKYDALTPFDLEEINLDPDLILKFGDKLK